MPRLSGRVLEKWTGLPVSGAVVSANGVTVIADVGGNFSIEVMGTIANVQVMHVGYTTVNESVSIPADIEIDLVPIVRSL